MISGGEYILDIIKLITEYDISIVFNTILRARTEMITEGLNNNLIIILQDRVLSNKLSDILKDFKNIIVNNDDIEELQSKKRKRNKYYYMEDVTHGFQFNITSNKKMDIIKYIQLFTQWRSFGYIYYKYINTLVGYLGL